MNLSFVDLTRAGASTGGRPSSISLIREATQAGLMSRGFECSAASGADLTLVDVLDDGDHRPVVDVDVLDGQLWL